MTERQYNQLCEIIRSGWSQTRFLNNDDISASLFNSLNRFDFQLCKDTIIDMIENGDYDESSFANQISVNKIIQKIEQAANRKKDVSARELFHRAVKCPVCNDNGYTMHRYPTGVEVMRPCACEVAQYKYPWAFQSEEQRKEWEEEEIKKGHSPRRAWRCKPEDYRKAYYGDDPEKEADNDKEVSGGRSSVRSEWVSRLLREVGAANTDCS